MLISTMPLTTRKTLRPLSVSRATKLVTSLEHKSYEGRGGNWDCLVKKRRLGGDHKDKRPSLQVPERRLW